MLNDVIKELQCEKEGHQKEIQDIKRNYEECQKRLELLEIENSSLRREKEGKDEIIEQLRNKVEDIQRTTNERRGEEDIVITEVNESEENC